MSEPLRNRIVGFERVPASSLVPHPQNWRTHPARQREALAALLDSVGFTGAVVARTLPDGRMELLDGHLRTETAGDELVPVVLVDLDDEEARKFLLTADPISGLAESDDSLLRELLAGMPALDPALLAGLQQSYGVDATPPAEPSAPARSAAEAKESTVKVVQLFLSASQHETFMDWTSALAEKYGTKTITETVLEAVRDAEAQVLSR